MTTEIFHVDSFTDKPFAGNPAGVCILTEPQDETWMQNVASEMNLSETAFVEPKDDGTFGLRWFTPKAEVDLCGHATLASAHILWEESRVQPGEPIQFDTRSGRLTCEKNGDWITMDFPAHEFNAKTPPKGMIEALGVKAVNVGLAGWYWLVELESEKAVRSCEPDFSSLLKATPDCVIITAKSSTDEFDFVSRFFAPKHKINEDPVTGSAHCALGPYWSKTLNKTKMTAYQASPRGGIIKVEVTNARVLLTGHAVTILRAQLQETVSV